MVHSKQDCLPTTPCIKYRHRHICRIIACFHTAQVITPFTCRGYGNFLCGFTQIMSCQYALLSFTTLTPAFWKIHFPRWIFQDLKWSCRKCLLFSPRILECDCHPHLHSVVLRRAKRVTNLCGFSHGKFQDCHWILIYLRRRRARECYCQICMAVLCKKRGERRWECVKRRALRLFPSLSNREGWLHHSIRLQHTDGVEWPGGMAGLGSVVVEISHCSRYSRRSTLVRVKGTRVCGL